MSTLVVGTLPQTRALVRRLRRSKGGGTVHFPTCEKALRTLRVHRTVLEHAYLEPPPPQPASMSWSNGCARRTPASPSP